MPAPGDTHPDTVLLPGNPGESHPWESIPIFEGHRTAEITLPLSSARREAISEINVLNLGQKINLAPDQSDTLKTIEHSLIQGDLQTLESTMRKFKDDPESARPIMDLLSKDLKSAGLYASYRVESTNNGDGKPEQSGLLTLSTAKDANDWLKRDTASMGLSTNPRAETWAENDVARPPNSSIITPESCKTAPDSALKIIGENAVYTLTGRPSYD